MGSSWTGIKYEESLRAFVEHYARDVIYLSAKMQKNPWAQKAGLHILQRDVVNVVQLLKLASDDTFQNCGTIFDTILWEMMPLLKERMDSVTLHGRLGVGLSFLVCFLSQCLWMLKLNQVLGTITHLVT